MIRTFCDMCGDEIPSNLIRGKSVSSYFPVKRIHINKNEYISNDFLVELIVTARIYEPENLLDEIKDDRFVGYNICAKCIIEALTQKER